MSVKSYYIPWSAAALNTIYKADQSTNSPFKREIVLKLAHVLGHLEQTTNSWTLTESPNFGPRFVNTRPWRHYPNMGSYLHPNMVKNANFRGLRRIWEVLPTSCGIINLPPRQPRFLARLPRWQLFCFKDTTNFAALLFFLTGRQWNVPAGKCDIYTRMMQMKPTDDWLKTRQHGAHKHAHG